MAESETERLIGLLDREIRRHPEIKLGILYGSLAQGTHRLDSDVDLAVAKDHREPLDEETLLQLSLEAGRTAGREVQVRDLARAQGVFLKEVLTKGVVIYQTDPRVRGELIIRMLDFVEDLLPTVRMIRRKKRERFLAGE
ncbi:MAG: type VII toxin-antitoxin system MntA family adenylyltransferase antitoxin [Spirochaetaceae bacterium]